MMLHHQALPSMDLTYPTASQGLYRSTNINEANLQTTNSTNSPTQPSGEQSTSGIHSASFGEVVPDLSAMMFPSADPFAYPNQPMTTLENRQFGKPENQMDSSLLDMPTTTGAPYNNYDAQLYGQMPPYLMQAQPPGYLQGTTSQIGMSSGDPGSPSSATIGFDGGHWLPSQQRQRSSAVPGMGFDQLFGEDWGGWMSQYRQ